MEEQHRGGPAKHHPPTQLQVSERRASPGSSNGAARRSQQITRSFNFPFFLLLEWQTPPSQVPFSSWVYDVCCRVKSSAKRHSARGSRRAVRPQQKPGLPTWQWDGREQRKAPEKLQHFTSAMLWDQGKKISSGHSCIISGC